MMKNATDILTIQIRCSGPDPGLTVTADSQGNAKGYAFNPDVMLLPKNGKLDVGGALGQGVMNVIKDMGLKEPYSGQTILQTERSRRPYVLLRNIRTDAILCRAGRAHGARQYRPLRRRLHRTGDAVYRGRGY